MGIEIGLRDFVVVFAFAFACGCLSHRKKDKSLCVFNTLEHFSFKSFTILKIARTPKKKIKYFRRNLGVLLLYAIYST
ncbi:hypothetical protein [Chryseobacterium carnipullorum]|uniref:hypothetical protein n=1 Tax=Chryseobacterium carnipullorum TaxID=1124835 RepID=UPI000F4E0879|nr:hypothetical protein [Chryseobacterium carnipullorum]